MTYIMSRQGNRKNRKNKSISNGASGAMSMDSMDSMDSMESSGAHPDFDLDELYALSKDMIALITWADSYARLELRLKNKTEIDSEIHTEELLQRRLTKHATSPFAKEHMELKDYKQEHQQLWNDMTELRPKVWDTKEDTHLADHERMSQMNDRRKVVEQKIDDYMAKHFAKLKEIVPKIYSIILDNIDEEEIDVCFKMMRRVMRGQLTSAQAFNKLADRSIDRHNLPKGFYKSMRM